jgi:cholesterol transport system auxiliary component
MDMTPRSITGFRRAATAALALLLLAACSPLQPPKPEALNTYVLDAQLETKPVAANNSLTLVVSPPRASPGFDTAHIAYVRQPHELDYFAKSRWADTPSRMLAPLLVRALEHNRNFRAVALAPSPVAGDLRLDTEIIRLQQDFTTRPSRTRFTLRAQLIDPAEKRIVKIRIFDATEEAPSDDPYGGVIAANRAVKRVLEELAEFCAVR